MTTYYGDDDDMGDRWEADELAGIGAFAPRPAYYRKSRTRYTCPTCKTPRALSAFEHARGYQCQTCTRREEGPC